MSRSQAPRRWTLLIHQLPPRPAYLRVKVGRRLAAVGAVSLKNTVYALPWQSDCVEDFQWVRREILASGGEATVLAAELIDGLTDAQVEAVFREARDADYAALAREVEQAGAQLERTRGRAGPGAADLQRLERRLSELAAIDYFQAPGRAEVVRALEALRSTLGREPSARGPRERAEAWRGRTWVTRPGIKVDRIASAWLIRRHLDPKAKFRFADVKAPRRPGEVRFDMSEAEFTHEGEECTFEVLRRRFALEAPALKPIAEIIHDLDLKDGRYGRAETAGVGALLEGLTARHGDDEARLEHGFELFDQLARLFDGQGGKR